MKPKCNALFHSFRCENGLYSYSIFQYAHCSQVEDLAAALYEDAAGLAAAHKVIARSDVLIEGFRPGVMERLGLGPADCPNTLIYARMTGFGQGYYCVEF